MICTAFVLSCTGCGGSATGFDPKEGDLVFQSLPASELGAVIESVSGSPLSHCGILTKVGDDWMVLEAIGPVVHTPWNTWRTRGKNQGVLVCRLKPDFQGHAVAMVEAAREFIGRPYDFRYRWDDGEIYCSEMVWKAYHAASGRELGSRQALRTLNWEPHREFIEKLEGGPVPLDRELITPAALAQAGDLERVFEKNLY